jgi:hypothetical protein
MKDADREVLIEEAIHLANSSEAAGLPGYNGKH